MNERSALRPKSRNAPTVVPWLTGLLQRKCACGGSSGATGSCAECERNKLLGKPRQTRLRVNEPGDAYEWDADRAAEQVMRMPEASFNPSHGPFHAMVQPRVNGNELSSGRVPIIQRAEAAGKPPVTETATQPGKTPGQQDEGSRCPSWRADPLSISKRAAAPSPTGSMDAGPLVMHALASPGRPLDAATREFFSARFGHDFARVRVHADAGAAESAHAINASAYTVGNEVVFGAGCYAPDTSTGRRLLAHELAHVVQQRAANPGTIQRQPEPETPKFPDFPGLVQALELNVGKNLHDYGHHLYRASILHPDEPDLLQGALARYALGLNVLKTSYRFAGFEPDTADKLALGTGIFFKGLTFVRDGEFVLDYQVNIGKGLKLESNIDLAVNPKELTQVRKGAVTFGIVGEF